MEITKGENANLAVMEPRCPKCGSNDLDSRVTNDVSCGVYCRKCKRNVFVKVLADYAQFFRSPVPTPPMDVEAEKRITEIRERESKATKAPWVTIGTSTEREPGCGISSQIGDGSSFRVANIDIDDLEFDEQNNNAEFIAHSRQDIPFLIEQISLLRRHIASPAPQSQPLIKKSRPIDQMEGSERIAWAAYQVLGCLFGIEGPARIMNWFHDVASGLEPSIDELFPITPEERKRYEWAASPAQPEKRDEWVSVDERLPDFGNTVLVVADGKTKVGYRREFLKQEDLKDWQWQINPLVYYGKERNRVTHWQPLPAPPQSGKEGAL